MNQMSTTSNNEQWLELITQCRASGLTDRQWCIQNGIPVSTFYYHIRALRKKACEIPAAADTAVQKQEVVQLPLWKTEQYPALPSGGGLETAGRKDSEGNAGKLGHSVRHGLYGAGI